MGRKPADFAKKKGMWSAHEDQVLKDYVKNHGAGKWGKMAKDTGLQRCGKSLRLRWLNYLRPGIARGNIRQDEEDLIIRMHKLVGNRWSLIAGRIPGRTDNQIKNYWNSTLSKKLAGQLGDKEPQVSENEVIKDGGSPYLSDEVLIGGGLLTCFAGNVNDVGVGTKNNCEPIRDDFSCKAAMPWNDLLTDLNNGGQLDISEFLQTDFPMIWEEKGRGFIDFEVGGCSTVNYELPNNWHC